MINETFRLKEVLEENGIQTKLWHDDYKVLPGGNNYRIWLSNEGNVAKIELMDKELAKICRKYGNNQQAFPAFNIAPLYRITDDEGKTYCKNLLEEKEKVDFLRLKAMCENDNWSTNLRKKVEACLRKSIPGVPEDSAIYSLMQICGKIEVTHFRDSFEDWVWKNLQNDLKAFLPLLIHPGNPNKEPDKDIGSVSVMFDLKDWEPYGGPIANEKTTNQINQWLLTDTANKDQPKTELVDAFGDPYFVMDKPMPRVKLIQGFEAVLRSMFREQPCQFRYGNADDRSYPISRENRDSTQAALEWISKPENEKITWRKIENSAMLFAYPDKLPKVPPKIVSLFAPSGENRQSEEFVESRFEAVAKDFLTTLDGLPPKDKPKNIHVFALQQIPPALSNRAKVVYTRNIARDDLVKAANDWQDGCHNVPKISFVRPLTPFPIEASKIVNKVWKLDGTQADGKSAVKVMQYYEGMDLLINAPQNSVLRILRGVNANWLGLVKFVGNNFRRKTGNKDAVSLQQKNEIGMLVPLLGLLLHKFKILKEDYMQETAFLIGQILQVSDRLHLLYCEIVRKGDIPPQLAGNGMFVTATEMPVRALAVLGTRMNPYISWANQYSYIKGTDQKDNEKSKAEEDKNVDKSALVGWLIGHYRRLMTQLQSKLTENMRFGELEKAQLFIGYLAKLPESEKKQANEQSNEQENQNE